MKQFFINLLTEEISISVYLSFCLTFAIALIKYIIPPLPCDLTILILSFLSILKNKPFSPILLGISIGGTIGALLAYRMGSKGKEFDLLGEKVKDAIKKFEQPFKKSYFFTLIFNRFLLGIRPIIFPLAGFYRINFPIVLITAAIGNIIYAIFIYFIVTTAGKEFVEIKGLYKILGIWIEFLLLSFIVLFLIFFYRKKLFNVIRKNKNGS